MSFLSIQISLWWPEGYKLFVRFISKFLVYLLSGKAGELLQKTTITDWAGEDRAYFFFYRNILTILEFKGTPRPSNSSAPWGGGREGLVGLWPTHKGWRFLTGDLKDWVIIEIRDLHDMWFLTCVPNFSSLACLEVPQEPARPRSHTWRTLKVPDWRLGGWGHPWH